MSKATSQSNTRLKMQYLGAMTLLGRIAKYLPSGHEDRFGLGQGHT